MIDNVGEVSTGRRIDTMVSGDLVATCSKVVPKFVVAQMGARMHYAVPSLLHRSSLLSHLYTDIYASDKVSWLLRIVNRHSFFGRTKRLAARVVPDIPSRMIDSFMQFGVSYHGRLAVAATSDEQLRVHLWAGERFCKLVLSCDPKTDDGLYCFNSASLELLQHWSVGGGRTVLEQTSAPRRLEDSIMRSEEEAFPGWVSERKSNETLGSFIEREETEWHKADIIVCGSEFARAGLEVCGGPVGRCVVVPYGIPVNKFRPVDKTPLRGRALRVLTIGQVGLQKGSHYIMEAAKKLGSRVEFRLVGPMALLPRRADELRKVIHYAGVVARDDITQHFDWADLFLLPSLCEGSATVTYEALSAGLPVVTTESTGSIVEDGVSGFIVPTRSSSAIIDAIESFLIDPAILGRMSACALARSGDGSLDAYGRRLIGALSS